MMDELDRELLRRHDEWRRDYDIAVVLAFGIVLVAAAITGLVVLAIHLF